MNNTPTPETDAARITEKNGCIATFGVSQVVSVKFARKLERERDEVRKDAAQLADRLSGLELRTTDELAILERERNEAHKIANRAIDDLAWFNYSNAQRLRAELNQLKEGAK